MTLPQPDPRPARLERFLNDQRFDQILKAFAERGVRLFVFVPDEDGVMHRLSGVTAGAVCGRRLPEDAKIYFYTHATCVWCV